MTDLQDNNRDHLIMQMAHDSVVTHPVSPQSRQVPFQGMTHIPGIDGAMETFPQEPHDAGLVLRVQTGNLPGCRLPDFNGPCQDVFPGRPESWLVRFEQKPLMR